MVVVTGGPHADESPTHRRRVGVCASPSAMRPGGVPPPPPLRLRGVVCFGCARFVMLVSSRRPRRRPADWRRISHTTRGRAVRRTGAGSHRWSPCGRLGSCIGHAYASHTRASHMRTYAHIRAHTRRPGARLVHQVGLATRDHTCTITCIQVLGSFIKSFGVLNELAVKSETAVCESFLTDYWAERQAELGPVPEGASSIALMRLTVQVQATDKQLALIEAFRALRPEDRQVRACPRKTATRRQVETRTRRHTHTATPVSRAADCAVCALCVRSFRRRPKGGTRPRHAPSCATCPPNALPRCAPAPAVPRRPCAGHMRTQCALGRHRPTPPPD